MRKVTDPAELRYVHLQLEPISQMCSGLRFGTLPVEPFYAVVTATHTYRGPANQITDKFLAECRKEYLAQD